MQTKILCVWIHIWSKGEVGAPLKRLKPSSKILLLTIPRRCFWCESFMFFVLFLLCFLAGLFIDALWSPAVKGLASWLSYVMSNYEVVTFPLVFWVRCGAWLIDSWSLPSFLLSYLAELEHEKMTSRLDVICFHNFKFLMGTMSKSHAISLNFPFCSFYW